MRRTWEALLKHCTKSVIDLRHCRYACCYTRESDDAVLSSCLPDSSSYGFWSELTAYVFVYVYVYALSPSSSMCSAGCDIQENKEKTFPFGVSLMRS